jgi:hypothetical protein
MAPKKAASNVPATSRARTKRSDGYVDLSPLESRVETALFERHEGVLLLNYDIPPTVRMFYQASDTRAYRRRRHHLIRADVSCWTPVAFPGDCSGFCPLPDGSS